MKHNIIAAINQPEMTLRKAQNKFKKRLTDCFDITDICFKDDEKELTGILELMAGKAGYMLDKDVKEKCFDIFKEAKNKKEFGNGRFVRNLLEQAQISQASRLIKESNGKKISAKTLNLLKSEDFNVNAGMYAKDDKKIGVCS